MYWLSLWIPHGKEIFTHVLWAWGTGSYWQRVFTEFWMTVEGWGREHSYLASQLHADFGVRGPFSWGLLLPLLGWLREWKDLGLKLIFHRTWYLKELAFKLPPDLRGLSSSAVMNCDVNPFLGVCLMPSLHGSLRCNFSSAHLWVEKKGNFWDSWQIHQRSGEWMSKYKGTIKKNT